MIPAATPDESFNLLVELDGPFETAAPPGYAFERVDPVDERRLSWLDLGFGETRSADLYGGGAWVASFEGRPAGIAGYAGSPSSYRLRAWRERPDAGMFGPLEIAAEHRTPAVARALAGAALASLRERGYRCAVIPVRGPRDPAASLAGAWGARVVERFPAARAMDPVRTTVLASGGGTNFQAVIDAVAGGLGLTLGALVCNRPGAFAIERARAAGIEAHVVRWDRANVARDAYDGVLIDAVAATRPELLLLLGWMHVLPVRFLQRFPNAVNIHPAFLPYDTSAESVTMPDGARIPAFRGAHGIADAVAAGSPWYGATAHRVDPEPDRGAVLARAPLRLTARDPAAALTGLRAAEHRVLISAIRRVLDER